MPEVFGFDAEGVERIREAVRQIEAQPRLVPGSAVPARGPRSPRVDVLRVTSTTTTTVGAETLWPAKLRVYRDTSTPTWDDEIDVWAVDPDRVGLTVRQYGGRLVGALEGRPVYAAFLSGSGSGSLTVRDEVGGTPETTVANVTTLTCDKTSGLEVTNPAAGEAEMALIPTSGTTAGGVNLADQNMGLGTKIFEQIGFATAAGHSGNQVRVDHSPTAQDTLRIYKGDLAGPGDLETRSARFEGSATPKMFWIQVGGPVFPSSLQVANAGFGGAPGGVAVSFSEVGLVTAGGYAVGASTGKSGVSSGITFTKGIATAGMGLI